MPYRDFAQMTNPKWRELSDRWWRLRWERTEVSDDPQEIAKAACGLCGVVTEVVYLQLHHITYDRFELEDYDDIVPLHKECHERLEDFIGAGRTSGGSSQPSQPERRATQLPRRARPVHL